jgi:hypothetical protein
MFRPKMIRALAAVALWLMPCLAIAQTSPNLTLGQVPTPGQWNGYFAAKQDTLGYVPLNSAGGTMSGPLVTVAPSSLITGFSLPPGTAPGSPANGDMWTTSLGLFVRINGTTIGPVGGASSASFAATLPVTVSYPSGITTYACPTCGIVGNPLSQFAATTSAQLAGIISDETGSGPLMFGTSPAVTGTLTAAAANFSGTVNHTGAFQIGGTAQTFPASGLLVGTTDIQSLTNKSLVSSTDVLGGVTMTLGSDATGDIWYRSAGGVLTRLPIGGGANVLTVSAGLPAWVAPPGGGNVSNTGTPTANQIAQWTNATTVQGANVASLLTSGTNITISGTTNATISLSGIVSAALGGSGVSNPATHTIPINQGSGAQVNTGTGTLGQALVSSDASADPAWQSGVWTLLPGGTLTASSSASLSFNFPSGYNEYQLVFENVLPATASVNCIIQVNVGGVQSTTYIGWDARFNGSSLGSSSITNGVPCAGLGASVPNTGTGISGVITVFKPQGTAAPKIWNGQFNASGMNAAVISGYWNGGNGAITGFQALFSTGLIASGTIKIYGRL